MSEDNPTRRRFLKATGGLATVLGVAGCSTQQEPETTTDGAGQTETETTVQTETETETETESPGQPDEGKVFQRINSTITTFDPVAHTDEASAFVVRQLFDTLTILERGEVNLQSLLATDWELSDDFKVITFTLADATFHDGRDVTADDVIYSFDRLAGSEHTRRAGFILDFLGVQHEEDSEGNYQPGSLAMEAVDDSTVRVILSEPFHSALEMLGYGVFAIHPEGIVGDIEGYDGEMSYQEFSTQNPIGCGPFQFVKWEQGTEAEVERYDDYYGQVPELAGVHWQIIEDDDAAYNYAMNKNADVFGIPTAQYDPNKVSVESTDDLGRYHGTYGPARNGETLQYLAVRELVTYYLGFNMEKIPKPVRQAFAYAMDQGVIVEEIFKERGAPAYHLTPPGLFPGGGAAYDQHAEQYPYGKESQIGQAQQVMEDAGYGSDNQFELTMTSYQSAVFESMLSVLRDQLASAYISMKIEPTPFSTILQRGRNGELEGFTLGWGPDWPEADNFLQFAYPPNTDTSQEAPVVYTNWSSETGDAAQDATEAWETVQANSAPTDAAQEARNEQYTVLEEAMWEDVPFVYLIHPLAEQFSYSWVDLEPYGSMGPSWQKYNKGVSLGDRS